MPGEGEGGTERGGRRDGRGRKIAPEEIDKEGSEYCNNESPSSLSVLTRRRKEKKMQIRIHNFNSTVI